MLLCSIILLSDHHGCGHVGVDSTVVVIGAGSIEGETIRAARVERAAIKGSVVAGDGMRNAVAIGPRDL